MDIYWYQDGTMIVSMINYLQKIIDDFPEVIRSTSGTYETEYLFKIWDKKDRKLFPYKQAQHFHQTVAKLLFLCIRDRPYIHTLVDFLTTRLMSPDEYDLGKLKQGLKYLKGTLSVKLYLHGNYTNMIIWCVDASYITHWDCKSHTRAVMLIWAGAIMSFSIK